LVLGAIGPITFLIVNAVVEKNKQISPAIAGASSFALAFAGMFVGSLVASTRTAVRTNEARGAT
jgi:hypothetical protein